MFGDLDWRPNASHRFVSISWASCFTGRMPFLSPNQQCQKSWRENTAYKQMRQTSEIDRRSEDMKGWDNDEKTIVMQCWKLWFTWLRHRLIGCHIRIIIDQDFLKAITDLLKGWKSDPPFSRHQSPHSAVGQTLHCRQPSFSGCRFLHLELAPWTRRQCIYSKSFQHHLKTSPFRRSFPDILL